MLSAAGYTDAVFKVHAAHSDQLRVATRFSDSPVLLFTLLSMLGIQGPAVENESSTYMQMIDWTLGIGCVILILTFTSQWYFIFVNFRSDIYELRRRHTGSNPPHAHALLAARYSLLATRCSLLAACRMPVARFSDCSGV